METEKLKTEKLKTEKLKTENFKGIWIAKEICDLESLGWTEKIILAEIADLSGEKGCYANNEHFAKLLNIRKDSISKIINRLVKNGYLTSKIKYMKNTRQVEERILKINENRFVSNGTNADTSMHKCQNPMEINPSAPSVQIPNKEYNIENNIEYNTYAQNPIQTKNLIQDENIYQRFERFYSAYPKKKSRGRALKWFKTHKPSSELVDTMIESLNKQKSTLDWQKENGRYIPYPASWLNSKGWEDETSPHEILDLSENSASRVLSLELYETLKNTKFTPSADTEKLIKSWTIEIEKYLSIERTREREDRVFYAINSVKDSNKWRKIIVDAKSLIKNIDFIM